MASEAPEEAPRPLPSAQPLQGVPPEEIRASHTALALWLDFRRAGHRKIFRGLEAPFRREVLSQPLQGVPPEEIRPSHTALALWLDF